jgi:hypothetical protein
MGMRSKVVPVRDMVRKYQAEVREFAPAFVLPKHEGGWEEKALDPAEAEAAIARAAIAEALTASRTRRATDKKPKFIEIKRRA